MRFAALELSIALSSANAAHPKLPLLLAKACKDTRKKIVFAQRHLLPNGGQMIIQYIHRDYYYASAGRRQKRA